MSKKFVLPECVRIELSEYLLREFGLQEVEFSIEYGSKNGDSYSSDIYRVVLKSSVNSKVIKPSTTNPVSYQYILKMSPTVEIRRQMFNTTEQFSQEHYMYSVVLPALEAFQLQYLDEKEIFSEYPKMISSSLVSGDEYILLEDMSSQGFLNFYRPTPLNFQQCSAVFQSLAKLHAVSFAYKDQRPKEFLKLAAPLKEVVFKTPVEKNFASFMKQKIDCAVQTLDEKDQHVIDRVLDFKNNLVDSMVECINEKTHAAIIHGDCWVSNLLFKEQPTSQIPAITHIDWQIARYGTPVIDLAYFTFCCTDSKLRSRLNDLLEIYYQTLAERIAVLKSDPATVFPYKIFKNHVQKYFKFGFGMALMSLHAIALSPSEMPDVISILDTTTNFERFNEIAVELTKRSAYRQRMADVCRDLVENNYI